MLRRLVLFLALLPVVAAAQTETPGASSSASARVPVAPAAEVREETALEEAPLYYVIDGRPDVFAEPDSALAFMRLDYREGVRVLEQRADGWSQIQRGRTRGWVATEALSNVWIYIDKRSRTLYVYRGTELVRSFPADVSQNPDDDKIRRSSLGEKDHYRIPEGTFFVCRKNLNSEYYRSFLLNYPTEEDAERGLREGLISRDEYVRIVRAAERFEPPPMGTALGGAIAIHGQGSGRRRAWTRGCVALRDVHIDAIWDLVEVGTPVLIR